MSNEGKVCIITGAAGGIGAAVVKKFYDNGYKVIMLDINEDALKESIEMEKYEESRIDYYVLDISSEDQVKAMVAKVKEKHHRVDALINVAAIVGKYNKTIEYGFDNFKKIYSINVFGTFLLMSNVLPIMVGQKSGAIVNFGSVSGMTGYTFEIGYGSSKWAVIGMTKNVANEYCEYGIRANSISPGWVNTKMFKDTMADYGNFDDSEINLGPMGRPSEPSEIADVVYYLCTDEAGFINGANILADGGKMLG